MISIHRYSLPLASAFVSSKGSITHRECAMVRLVAGPSCGLGEASPMPGLCPDPLDQVQAELDALDGAIPGLPRNISEVDSWVQSLAQTSAVQHALGSALIDCMAQANGRSIATLLNPRARRDVPISHLYTDDDKLLHAVMLGTQTVKVKVGIAPLSEEVAKIASIRSIVGPDVALRLDANGAWTEDEATRAIEAFVAHKVRTIEDPVGPHDYAAMARLRGRGIDIAADEAVTSSETLDQIIAASAADVIVIKPMRVGTPLAALRLIQQADQARLDTIITTTIDGAVGRMMALHIAAAAPTARLRCCGLNTGSWLQSDFGRTPEWSGSHVDTPTEAGLGVEWTP